MALSIITAPVIAAVSVGKEPDSLLCTTSPEADGQNKPGTLRLSVSRHGAVQRLERGRASIQREKHSGDL